MLIEIIKEMSINEIDIKFFQVHKSHYKVILIIKIVVQNNKNEYVMI